MIGPGTVLICGASSKTNSCSPSYSCKTIVIQLQLAT